MNPKKVLATSYSSWRETERYYGNGRAVRPLIDICFDADRLDLFYRGITPDPALMATEIGSYYAEHYDEYLTDIQKIRI